MKIWNYEFFAQRYLSWKSQHVKISNNFPRVHNVATEIPQRSIKALFFIVIKDIGWFKIICFLLADDLKVYKIVSGPEDIAKLPQNLNTLNKYARKIISY